MADPPRWWPAPFRGREGGIALAIALVAALRVWIFASAFPFFSNVDEHRHVDAVLKYARGYASQPGADAYEPEMPTLLGTYGSPEYHQHPGSVVPPPPWRGDPARTIEMIEYNERFLLGRPNLEAFQPPIYYAVAGAWLDAGRALGLSAGGLLYWVRFLNAVTMFALVVAGYVFLCRIYLDDAFTRLGVPALLAVFPQDVFYYTTRDSFSPLLGAAGLLAAVAVSVRPRAGYGWFAAAGLVGAIAFLSKYTNGVVLALYALATLWGCAAARERRPVLARYTVLWVAAAVPIALWLGRNVHLFGEVLATGAKLERLGWGRKGFLEMWHHPIWSPSGFSTFVSELLPTFWRGELAWERATLACGSADAFYTASSLTLLALAVWGWARRPRGGAAFLAEGFSIAALVVSAGVLIVLSMSFVFGEKTNPTADNPYLSQGRLVGCALFPFALLYVRGISVGSGLAPPRWRGAVAWSLLGVAIAVVAVSELWLSAPVFASAYNWFGLP